MKKTLKKALAYLCITMMLITSITPVGALNAVVATENEKAVSTFVTEKTTETIEIEETTAPTEPTTENVEATEPLDPVIPEKDVIQIDKGNKGLL